MLLFAWELNRDVAFGRTGAVAADRVSLMLVPAQQWSSRDERSVVRVVELSPERAVIERVLRPGSGKAGPHVHRDWLQGFEAVDGELRIRVDKEAPRLLAVGETVQVPRGVVHVDPWNESAAPAIVRRHRANPSCPCDRGEHRDDDSLDWNRGLRTPIDSASRAQ